MIHVIASGFVESEHDEVVDALRAAGFAARARLGSGWQAVLLERGRDPLLDPAAAAAAGARHHQLASGLPGGGLALSCQKLVEDGARVMLLLAPGLFRLDVRPVEDTLQVMTRSLHEGARWGAAAVGRDRLRPQGGGHARAVARGLHVPRRAGAAPVLARIELASTVDRERGLTHFVAHAIVREVEPGSVRWRGRE